MNYVSGLAYNNKEPIKAVNCNISRSIIEFAIKQNVSFISIEDLTNISQKTNRKVPRPYRYKHSSGVFAQLQDFIGYKAQGNGIIVMHVNTRNTSRTCSGCNHISQKNRKGLQFKCKACNHQLHADLNAARNIEHRSRDLRYTLRSQGYPSTTHTNACILQDVWALCVSEGQLT